MKRYVMGVVVLLLLAGMAHAQDDTDALLALLDERYQPGDALIVFTGDETDGKHMVAAVQKALPDSEVRLQTEGLILPESPERVLILMLDKAETMLDIIKGYARSERAETETAALLVYRRTPALLQPLAEFGDSVVLMGWKVKRNAYVHPCDVLTLASWWQITAPVPMDYSMTFALNPTDQDDGIARIDGAPANSQMRLWQVDSLYYDERELTVPCDAQPGEYFLVAGIYDWTNGESLWVMPDDGVRIALMALRITDD